jgi:hypothetical protein
MEARLFQGEAPIVILRISAISVAREKPIDYEVLPMT